MKRKLLKRQQESDESFYLLGALVVCRVFPFPLRVFGIGFKSL
jgi:hypothetical protein